MKLIHLSDTHLVPNGKKLYGLDPYERLAAAVAHINAHHADAELCVVTGDLAHWGERLAYDALAELLAMLTAPYVLLLGNHDDRAAFRARFPGALADEHGFVQGRHGTSAGTLLFLDTNAAGTHGGRYCLKRQEWLRTTLNETGGQLLLFMHHPPFEIGISSLDNIGLAEGAVFAEIVQPHAGRIRHLFLGHVHRPVCGSWLGIPFSIVRGTNHQVALELRPHGAEIPGSHEPPAYAIVLVERDRVVIHTCEFLDDSRRFPLDAGEKQGRNYALAM